MSKYLIVGLGNPGEEYRNSRHNIGFDVVDAFVWKHQGAFRVDRLAEVAEIRWKGRTFICIKPSTYMNQSGKAFRYWQEKEKIVLANTLTIVDDLALPLSKLRLRMSGSHGGHNGLFDIQTVLGTDKYPRLRFGIGHHFPTGMQVDFVLGKWFPEERPIVAEKIEKSVEVIEDVAFIGIERTMNLINSMEFGNKKV
ncbi:MAG: aminoacyl-tRNA hydrolase [Chitinophagaceae bacterium]|nr:aminoacyl-tRNA hydrolase [Chitinophagaceae bacterium]